MRPDGVLTTVDIEPERQQFARQAFRAAGFVGNRARFIPGRALDVLPRLADGGYDLVFCDGDRIGVPGLPRRIVAPAAPRRPRLLRRRLRRAAAPSTPPPSPPRCSSCASCCGAVRESTALVPSLLPVGDGLLCAVKRER